ncbi:MAG TPA: hypothetical protein VFD74_04940, partial [Thermoleophilia bacterium]|nr:hypothetical protein [Thermoleophilia bacterium]
LVTLCAQCAGDEIADQKQVASSRSADEQDATSASRARSLIMKMIDRATQEHSRLHELDALVGDLASRLAAAQLTALEQEERARGLAAELDRTRERLRRAEELLALANDRPAPAAGAEGGSPHGPAAAPQVHPGLSELTPADVNAIQRAFNDSTFIEKMRSVRRGLGKPIVNACSLAGPDRRALLTVAWDIVWYQFLFDLSDKPEAPGAALFAEGMELSEIADHFKQSNAMIDDQGRLDASELALSLERDHPANEEALDEAEAQALDDATEEIWDSTSMPEFRWED